MKDPRTPLDLFGAGLDEHDVEELIRRAESDPRASADLDLAADLAAVLADETVLPAPAPVHSVSDRTPGPVPAGEQRSERRVLRRLAVLALPAAALLLLFVRRNDDAADVVRLADRRPPTAVAAQWRGPADTDAERLRAALASYHAGDHATAERLLDELLSDRPEHSAARFYRAACYEHRGEPASAQRAYERVAAEAEGLLAEHARWRLAQLALAAGRIERARDELAWLRDAGGEFAPNAVELLAALEALASPSR